MYTEIHPDFTLGKRKRREETKSYEKEYCSSFSDEDTPDFPPDAILVKGHHYHDRVVKCEDFDKEWKCSLLNV